MKLSEFIRSSGFEPKDLSDDQLDSMAEWHCASAAFQGGGEADGDDDLRKVDATRRHARIQEIESLLPDSPVSAITRFWVTGRTGKLLRNSARFPGHESSAWSKFFSPINSGRKPQRRMIR